MIKLKDRTSTTVKNWWQNLSLRPGNVHNHLAFRRLPNRTERGFSLIELLLVVVIIGVVAALAIPAFQKGIWAAENGTAFAVMRTINSSQTSYFTQNGRFGRLAEINQQLGNGIGAVAGDRLVRGKYVFEMSPIVPTDNELRQRFTITATRAVVGELTYQYELTQSGEIQQILP